MSDKSVDQLKLTGDMSGGPVNAMMGDERGGLVETEG